MKDLYLVLENKEKPQSLMEHVGRIYKKIEETNGGSQIRLNTPNRDLFNKNRVRIATQEEIREYIFDELTNETDKNGCC